MPGSAHSAVEEVARASYGRLVAYLATTTSDVAAAEDALADAFEAALRTWPDRGVPDRPTSWMITAARRALIGRSRRDDVARRALPSLAALEADRAEPGPTSVVGDHRLELLFACAHPAIDESIRAPLMLQVVLGLDAARMAPAFQVRPAALGQRLVRAKHKIRSAGIRFTLPAADELVPRASAVLDAIYAAYSTGWEDPLGSDEVRAGLTLEAIRLAQLMCELLPDLAEAHGLAALTLHSHARAGGRRDESGSLVPLDRQDTTLWAADLIVSADAHLTAAFALRSPGPYQIHAAIQSLHNRRATTGTTDWRAIAGLYGALVLTAPGIGASVARAAAHLEASGPDAAGSILDRLDPASVADYQPYWAVRAEVLHRGGAVPRSVAEARDRAVALTTDPAVARHLLERYQVQDGLVEVSA